MMTIGLMTAAALAAAPNAAIETTGTVPDNAIFGSYTDAYELANNKPMLVVLNPGADAENRVDVAALQNDTRLSGRLAGVVVAEIDATTDHGRQVHELFKSPTLPHVVVISAGKKQVHKESGSVSPDALSAALGSLGQGTTVTSYRPVSEPVAMPVSTPSYSALPSYSAAPSVTTPAPAVTVPSFGSLVPAAPAGECKACQKYRAFQF